jgi:hypothetical protein
MSTATYWEAAKNSHANNLVRLVYTDEAGIGDERQEPFTVVAAVPINGDTQWRAIDADIVDLRKDHHVPAHVELKACHIFWGTDAFKSWKREDRVKLQRDFLLVLDRYKLKIFYGGIERAHFKQILAPIPPSEVDQQPQDIAFLMAMGDFENYLCGDSPGEVGAVIADNSDRENVFKESLSDYRKRPLRGIYNTKFNHLIEPVLFTDSKESWGIQFADHCAYFIKRHLMEKSDSEEYYNLIKGLIWNDSIMASETYFRSQLAKAGFVTNS